MEIERKFLIRYPDIEKLMRQPGCIRLAITQTYLSARPGVEHRVRKSDDGQDIKYTETRKWEVGGPVSRGEENTVITEQKYEKLLADADPSLRTIEKTRYCIPFGGHFLEIDVYPFFSDCAILEVELQSETEPIAIPSYCDVIREVTDDKRFRNGSLAREIPILKEETER